MLVNKFPLIAGLVVVGMSGVGSVWADEAANADVRARCESEAAEYGVAPEQLQEYIDGCVMAAGAPAPAAGSADEGTAEEPAAADAPASEDTGSGAAQ